MRFFLAIHGLIFLYLMVRVVFPLRLPVTGKVALTLIFLIISQHYQVRMIFGQMGTPEVASPFIIFEGVCFTALLFFFILVIAEDIVILSRLVFKLRRNSVERFSPERRKALMAMVAAVPAVWGVRCAIVSPDINSMEERSQKLPRELDGLVIAHISDMHISPLFDRDWTRILVERINGLNPDLILITGDMVDGTPGARAEAIAPLSGLKAKHGVYGCMGNHEYYWDVQGWRKVIPKLGINMLENRHEVLTIRGKRVVVAGVTDEAAVRFGLPGPDVGAAMANAPDDALRIMLAHRPSLAPPCAEAGVDLQLSGHTHGGHILGMDHVVAGFNHGFVYGWYPVDGMRLYVNSGAGLWNGFPIRLGVPPEIAKIVLRKI